jgi:hypothetical protein
MINLLIEKGFPPRWVSTVLSILKSSASTVKVNIGCTREFVPEEVDKASIPTANLFSSIEIKRMARGILVTRRPCNSGQGSNVFHATTLHVGGQNTKRSYQTH